MKYTQCTLEKTIVTGTAQTTSWIPQKFAKLNHILKLKNEAGTWENGWKVIHLGNTVEEHLLPDSHSAIKQHRKNTGDASR